MEKSENLKEQGEIQLSLEFKDSQPGEGAPAGFKPTSSPAPRKEPEKVLAHARCPFPPSGGARGLRGT